MKKPIDHKRYPLEYMQITAIYLGLRADKDSECIQYLKQIATNKGIAVYEMQKNELQAALVAKKIEEFISLHADT